MGLHEHKTKIVNLRGYAKKKYTKGFDFLGFTIRPNGFKYKGGVKALPGIYVSTKFEKAIAQKFKYIQPGKPTQNAFVERFNGSFRRGVLDCPYV